MRYLTPESKALEMERWDRTVASATASGFTDSDSGISGDVRAHARPGGYGYVDAGILSLCSRLNAIEGVCTLQSCEGHVWQNGGTRGGGETLGIAQLWVWLSEPNAKMFYRAVPELVASSLIDQASLLWGRERDGREIVDLLFRGTPHGNLGESGRLIESFLVSLQGVKNG